jgi:hypothetical protein
VIPDDVKQLVWLRAGVVELPVQDGGPVVGGAEFPAAVDRGEWATPSAKPNTYASALAQASKTSGATLIDGTTDRLKSEPGWLQRLTI